MVACHEARAKNQKVSLFLGFDALVVFELCGKITELERTRASDIGKIKFSAQHGIGVYTPPRTYTIAGKLYLIVLVLQRNRSAVGNALGIGVTS